MLDRTKSYSFDSRFISKGDTFICLPKGKKHIKSALDNGAEDVIHLSREQFAKYSNEYFENPSDECVLIGITGTNGKTSVSYFVSQLLRHLGEKVLVIGTMNNALTTPESWDIAKKIRAHVDNGGRYVVLEVSSHGIDQKRINNLSFDIKGLTNITHDHLDYHKTFEHYKKTKLNFMKKFPGKSIFQDSIGLLSRDQLPQFTGNFHLKNISMAVEICVQCGFSMNQISPLLDKLSAPEGRFELVDLGQPFKLIIDFAHTPDGLQHVLKDALAVADYNKDKLKVVFGCGGDRDSKKRKRMGIIAQEYSHQIILTADNSRSENTLSIINEIQSNVDSRYIFGVYEDRQDAIHEVVKSAEEGDVILIAGKGHENYQVESDYSYWFNDREIAKYEILRNKKFQISQKWVLNNPNEDSDVLFISKNLISNLKITYSQFKRAIPIPSASKVEAYIDKIKGQKVLILEKDSRLSISEIFISILKAHSNCLEYSFDSGQSLEYNLSGITLIDQTSYPIVFKVNPLVFTQVKKVIDIIQPDHVIIGDIFDQNGFIDINLLKSLHHMISLDNFNSIFWCYKGMSDISDYIKEEKPDEVNFYIIKAFSWVDYIQSVIEDLIIKLDMQNFLVGIQINHYLLSKKWYQKVTLKSSNVSTIILDWNKDSIDLKQKIEFLDLKMEELNHYIHANDQVEKLIIDLNISNNIDKSCIFIDKSILGKSDSDTFDGINAIQSIKDDLFKYYEKTLVIWKLPNTSCREIMRQIN